MPACRSCNGRKRESVFDPSPIVQITLQRAAAKAPEAQRLAEEVVSTRKLSLAVNTLLRAGEKGPLPASALESLRPLLVFHMGHRSPELVAAPIRLTPDVAMIMEIQFDGGPRSGEVIASGNPGLEVDAARWLLFGVSSFIRRVEEGGPKPKSFLTWRQPIKEIAELAKAKGWSEEELDARMKYHIYEVPEYEWTDRGIRFKAEYQGIE
jgi:hypothetical protein